MMGFNQSLYSINEDEGPAKLMIILSNPLSVSFNIEVLSTDESATGKYVSILKTDYCYLRMYDR